MQLKSNINSIPKNESLLANISANKQGNPFGVTEESLNDEFAKLLDGAQVNPLDLKSQEIPTTTADDLIGNKELNKNVLVEAMPIPITEEKPTPSSVANDVTAMNVTANTLDSQVPVTTLNSNQEQILTKLGKSEVITNPDNSMKNVQEGELQSIKDILKVDGQKNIQLNRNAEDASRQFMPGRKSIFDITKNAISPAPSAPLAAQMNPVNPVDPDNLMTKPSAFGQKLMAQMAYQNDAKDSIFNKKLESKLESISRSTPQNKIMEMMLEQDVRAMDRHIQVAGASNQNMDLGSQLATHTPKVFDMNSLRGTENRDVIIDQIQNYIIQAKAASEPKVEMSFRHQELGIIDLQVQKAAGDQISISIATNSAEGMKFFTQNQGELLGSLTSAGIKVADLKLDNNSTASDFSQDSGQRQQQGPAGDQRQQDSRRREELWNLFKERREAA